MRRAVNNNVEKTAVRTVRRRRRRLTPFGRFVRNVIVLLLTVLILLGGIRVQALASDLNEQNSVRMERVYTSVQIHTGDTLWKIAENYGDVHSNSETAAYVKELKKMNHITDECSLKPGAFVLVYNMRAVEE